MGTPGRQAGLGAVNPLLKHPVNLIGRYHAASQNVRLAAIERGGDLIERGARPFFHDDYYMGTAIRCHQDGATSARQLEARMPS
jgi:hypothetical protein